MHTTDPTDPSNTAADLADAGAAEAAATATAADGADTAGADATQDPPAPSEEEQALALVDQALADPDERQPPNDAADPAAVAAASDPKKDPPADGGAAAIPPDKQDDAEAEAEAAKLGLGREKNEAANAKFKELYATAKRVPNLEERAGQYEQHVQYIEATGASPEQYQRALTLIGAVNRGGPTEWAQAREFLQAEIDNLDEKLGRGKSGTDPLAAHPDLAEAVSGGNLDRAYAEELARTRGQTTAQQRWAEEQGKKAAEVTDEQRAAHECSATLDALGERLKKEDPDYQRKVDVLVPTLGPVFANLPYAARPKAFLDTYRALNLPAVPAAAAAKPLPSHQAMRPTGGNGHVAKVPTTEMEALEAGLAAFQEDPSNYR